jgi:hypothetical protein
MTRTTVRRAKGLACVAGLAFGGILLFAGTDWSNKDASTWTDADVRAILNDSPWSKQARLSSGQSSDSGNGGGYGGGGGGGGLGSGGIGGGGMGGGMGGGGMGGGGMGGGGRGMGGNRGGMGRNSQPDVEVTVQWYSSKPVRLATQKRQSSDAKAEPLQPLDHYVIAVVGFPSGGSRRGGDSDDGSDSQPGGMSESMQDRIKDSSMLTRKGHDPIHPDKAAWDNSSGTRTLMLYFPKTDAITAADKDVEVQVAMGRMQLKKKFALKEMTYGGNLEL